MWELIKAGGWLMLPLVLCSIFTVAISIERFIRLRRSLILPKQLLIHSGKAIDQIINNMGQNKETQFSTLGQVLLSGYQSRHENAVYARAQMEAKASQEIAYLEKNINFLGTLSAAAPLLGLLGTVIGIIESFLMLDITSSNSPLLMIPGISKALITTAAGMLVAIPALFAYRYFQRLIQEYIAELEQQATLFHAALFFKNTNETVMNDQ
ncbi:MotA/TolQ/ExbB proton channel family protein [Acinetobacter stercoris]|uniref:Biopolymer transport protein ExbB n=1 Tax=Acinetobacter stercoris TaxID=2126983 RepID=A0A2U3MWT9_9GAMM|nr:MULTISPECIES: MotA/TolQ/ExbB proton channel family protein [Acinetobacter]SPL69845.1 Biopolymer transport protein ExbB [Acinetobacter stercoris]